VGLPTSRDLPPGQAAYAFCRREHLFNVYPTENIRSRVVGGVASPAAHVGIFPYNSISPFGFNGASYYGKVNYKF